MKLRKRQSRNSINRNNLGRDGRQPPTSSWWCLPWTAFPPPRLPLPVPQPFSSKAAGCPRSTTEGWDGRSFYEMLNHCCSPSWHDVTSNKVNTRAISTWQLSYHPSRGSLTNWRAPFRRRNRNWNVNFDSFWSQGKKFLASYPTQDAEEML